MATTNRRNKPGESKPQSGRSSNGRRTAQDQGHSLTEMRDEMSGYLSQGAEQLRHMTRDREGATMLVALAAGFGVGLAIGCSLASSHRQPKSWRDRRMVDGLGRKIMARVESMIPEAVAEHFNR